MNPNAEPLNLRRLVYTLLITVAAGIVAARIVSVARLSDPGLYRAENHPEDTLHNPWARTRPEPMPTHGDNDRSRWDTVRALVDNGTYVIGHRDTEPGSKKYTDSGIITEDGWKTIDKVLRPDTQDFYSSKPPFLATIVAGEYWLLKKCLGWSITENRFEVVRTILLTFNWLPLLIYLFLLSRLLEMYGTTDWGRLYVMAAAALGTLLTVFANTFNNHCIATYAALFALYPAMRIWSAGQRGIGLFMAAGFFAAFAAACEMPATSFAVQLFLILLVRAPGRTLLFFLPAAAIPVAAFLWTNYLAVGQLRPAYGEFGGPWYEYEGSHWQISPGEVKHGIDWAFQVEGPAGYAFNLLLGHHGVLSLSPIFLLAIPGMLYGVAAIFRRSRETGSPAPLHGLGVVALMTLILSVVVISFYIFGVNPRNRNYGGWTNGLRWLMWLTPFWLLTMLPVVDWLAGRRWGRACACLLLFVSVLSANYREWTPWRHPWLYDLLEWRGMIPY